jgi:hypothetical protein
VRLFRRRKHKNGPDTTAANADPLLIILETQAPATAAGPGVRSCSRCHKMWHSPAGELADSVQPDERPPANVLAAWPEVIGLICPQCRLSWCTDHMGQPNTEQAVPQAADYACPRCRSPLSYL